jgi:formylglycine-generating enzyme required for sulfatase activity
MCLNDYKNPGTVDGYSNKERKVLRGGSFVNLQDYAAASSRNHSLPYSGHGPSGFRLVLGDPMRL